MTKTLRRPRKKIRDSVGLQTVYVLLPMEWAYPRGVARGVARFVKGFPRVSIAVGDQSGLESVVREGMGPVISMFGNVEHQRSILTTRWPVINVSSKWPGNTLPRVIPDNRQIGRMAGEHLLSVGFRNFVFSGQGDWFSQLRQAGFSEALAERNRTCRVIDDRDDLRRELPGLPVPTAIFADSDRRARLIVQICRDLSLHVPADIAVMGVDNEEILSQEMTPQLTTVDINAERVGFEAARLVFDMLAGRPAPRVPLLIPPNGVVVRESTNALAVDSPALARAVNIIWSRACEGVTVGEVAVAAQVPRRTLHRLCREHLGLSVSEVIRRQRIDSARRLLAETDRTIADVAESCGFTHYGRFHALFRSLVGLTPGTFRRQRRLR